jgi:HK97 gp10 family phage protein
MLTSKVVGDKEILADLRKNFPGKIEDKVFGAITDGVNRIRGEAKRRVPVDTGRLRFSLSARAFRDKMYGVVYADYPKNRALHKSTTKRQKAGTPDYYAMCVEYGTRRQKAQPFLIPAAKKLRPWITKQIKQVMEGAVK